MAEGSTSDRGKLASAAERAHRNRLLQDADLVKVLESEAGRRFMYRLLYVIGGLENLSYVGPGLADQMYYLEGRRSVVADVRSELQRVAPESYTLMVQERVKALARERVLTTEPAGPPTD